MVDPSVDLVGVLLQGSLRSPEPGVDPPDWRDEHGEVDLSTEPIRGRGVSDLQPEVRRP